MPPSMKGATSSSAPVLAAVKLDMPSAELALIVQHCTCAKVTPATGILAHAGKVVVPAVPAPSPAATPAPAPAHPVITSSTAATAASSMTTTPSATDAPTAPRNVKPAREPRESARDSKTTSTSRAEREKGGDSKRGAGNSNGNNGKGGRGKAETKSEVDTSSAIQLLEKSCLQKPTAGGLPAKSAAPVKVDRPVPKVEASAPVPSVWKIPAASGSGGVQESKASEGVKSLKEIQVSLEN